MVFPDISALKKQLLTGERKTPIHIAISTGKLKRWAVTNKKEMSEALEKHSEKINLLINKQIKHKFPIMTIRLPTRSPEEIKTTIKLFDELAKDERITTEKIRVFVIGQWYDIDSELVTSIKNLMDVTKDFDNYFINFCVGYDGQEEILGAVRLIAKKVALGKIKPDDVNLETFKENMYTSYFTPPELIIESYNKYSGVLLWDAKNARIAYTNKLWLDFTASDFEDILANWQKM